MKAQELRDRLAAVRNFDVKVDDDVKIEEVVIDITNNTVYLYTKPLPKEEAFTRMEEPKGKVEKIFDNSVDKLFDGLTKTGGDKSDSKSTDK